MSGPLVQALEKRRQEDLAKTQPLTPGTLEWAWAQAQKPFQGYWDRQGLMAREGLAMADQGAQQVRQGDLSGLAGMVLGPANYLSSPINALFPIEEAQTQLPKEVSPFVAGGLDLMALAAPGPKGGRLSKVADAAEEGITAYHGSQSLAQSTHPQLAARQAEYQPSHKPALSPDLQAPAGRSSMTGGQLSDTGPLQSLFSEYSQQLSDRKIRKSRDVPLAVSDPAQAERNRREWFGKSQIVDQSGDPKMVFHASPSGQIEAFSHKRLGSNTDEFSDTHGGRESSRLGTWFNEKDVSEKLAFGDSGTVYPAHLKIENPYHVTLTDLLSELDESSAASLKRRLKARGYDGLVVDDNEFGGWSYVVFDPRQIKSAIGNSGEYNPNDARIAK